MKKYKIENIFTGEIEEKSVEDMTSFRIGQEVIHRNEGEHGGSGRIIKHGKGIIEKLDYAGFGFLGHTIVASVKWESGEDFSLNVCLLQDSIEKRESINPSSLRIFK